MKLLKTRPSTMLCAALSAALLLIVPAKPILAEPIHQEFETKIEDCMSAIAKKYSRRMEKEAEKLNELLVESEVIDGELLSLIEGKGIDCYRTAFDSPEAFYDPGLGMFLKSEDDRSAVLKWKRDRDLLEKAKERENKFKRKMDAKRLEKDVERLVKQGKLRQYEAREKAFKILNEKYKTALNIRVNILTFEACAEIAETDKVAAFSNELCAATFKAIGLPDRFDEGGQLRIAREEILNFCEGDSEAGSFCADRKRNAQTR